MHEQRYKIRGHWWKVRFAELDGKWADCDHDERSIRLDHRLCEEDMRTQVGAIIHEVAHACFPDLTEDAVTEHEDALVDVLCDQLNLED